MRNASRPDQAFVAPPAVDDDAASDRAGSSLLLRPIAFDAPALVPSIPSWNGLIPFAFWIVDAVRPRVLVELGTYKGNSYLAFCQAVARLGLPTSCFAIDTWQGDCHTGAYDDGVYRELSAYHDPLYGHFSRLVRATFDAAVSQFDDAAIDLLHIDGAHSYEAVRHDFETWLPKLSPHAVVLFHDISVREPEFGVWRFWEEIARDYPSFALLHSHGLGILAVGRSRSDAVSWLTDRASSSPELTNEVRSVFSGLGKAVVAAGEAAQARREVDDLQRRQTALQQRLAERDREFLALSQRTAERDRELSQSIADLDGQVRRLREQMSAVLSSPSWRITKPVRWIARYLLRGAPAGIRDRSAQRSRDVGVIAQSGLFDGAWYLAQNPDVAKAGVDPLVHFVEHGAAEGRDPNPLFDTSWYAEQTAEVGVGGANPFAHFLERGARDGRPGWPGGRVLQVQAPYLHDADAAVGIIEAKQAGRSLPLIAPGTKIGVYTSSLGNYFFGEIRDLVAAALAAGGYRPVLLDETRRRPDDLGADLVIAPHEFLVLGEGPRWRDRPMMRHAFLLNTEQWQTAWFARSFDCLRRSDRILDMNLQSAAGLCALGLPAKFLPLGYVRDFPPFAFQAELPDLLALKGLPQRVRRYRPSDAERLEDRPLDLLFLGGLSPRREAWLVEHAARLANFESFLHVPRPSRPLVAGSTAALDTPAAAGLAQRSKIQLNIHRDDTPYFEWHRIVLHGIGQKTVVVSEPCFAVPGFKPGQHYIEAKLDEMPDVVEWLVRDRDGRETAERIRQQAFDVLVGRYDFADILRQALSP